jgi:hypothetical protein
METGMEDEEDDEIIGIVLLGYGAGAVRNEGICLELQFALSEADRVSGQLETMRFLLSRATAANLGRLLCQVAQEPPAHGPASGARN